jgi:general secretion pathway protein D
MTGRRSKFITLALAASAVLTAGCAGERLHHEGLAAIDNGKYEEGIGKLQEAVRREPNNLSFRLDLRAREEAAVQKLIAEADAARGAGRRDEAGSDYRRVLSIDPANDRALRGLEGVVGDERHAVAIAGASKDVANNEIDRGEAVVRAVLAEDPGFAPAIALQQKIVTQRGPVQATPKLKTRDNRPVTLQFRDANTKMVFEVLSRETGINFVFDKDIKLDGRTTIFVQDVPIESAIDLVLGQNQLARQVLSPNMVMIYPNTAAKQKDYQDEIVKTIYLSDADPKQAQTLIKTMLNPKAMFVDERSGVIVVRDTPEIVRMAEKLVSSVDLPDAEVMLEVEVLEITHSRMNQLGIQYPGQVSLAMTATGGARGLFLSDLHKQNSGTISVSSLGVTLNALQTSGNTNTLASPRIRARNKEKAKILIGQRVPVLTNSVTPTSTGAPVVTGSIQYLDVGLTLEVEPTIHRDGDVAIKLALEVSTLGDAVTNSAGSVAYKIGTRNTNTTLQLKDGETQILAGLIQDSDTRSANNVPGLGEIPLLGRLFGTQTHSRDKTEIVLAVTPRIIRAQRRPSSDNTEFWYGTESSTRSGPLGGMTLDAGGGATAGVANIRPIPVVGTPPTPSSVLQSTFVPAPAAAAPAAAAVDAPAGDAAGGGATAPDSAAPTPDGAPPAAPGSAAPSAPGGPPALSWQAPTEVHVGEEFDVTLQLASPQALTQLRSQVKFDPAAVELLGATAGGLVAATSPRIDTPRGGASLDANATAEAPVQGNGDLVVLHFKALAARSGTTFAARLAASGARGGVGMPTAPTHSVTIKH